MWKELTYYLYVRQGAHGKKGEWSGQNGMYTKINSSFVYLSGMVNGLATRVFSPGHFIKLERAWMRSVCLYDRIANEFLKGYLSLVTRDR